MMKAILLTVVIPCVEGALVSWIVGLLWRRRIRRQAYFDGGHDVIRRLVPLCAHYGVPEALIKRALGAEPKPPN